MIPAVASDRQARVVHPDLRVLGSSPDVMSGTPVFTGTRVPVQTLLDEIVSEIATRIKARCQAALDLGTARAPGHG